MQQIESAERSYGITAVAWLGLTGVALAQEEDESKSIKAEVFIKDRQAAPKRSRRPAGITAAKSQTKSLDCAAEAQASRKSASPSGDSGRDRRRQDKGMVEEADNRTTEWTLERIEEGTPLAPGQRVRHQCRVVDALRISLCDRSRTVCGRHLR
jgi:hypothetical protein